MSGMKIVEHADFGVYYDADATVFDPAVLQQAGLTREKFIEMHQGCPSIGFEDDGKQFGGALLVGNFLHYAVLPAYQRRWGSLLRGVFAWAFSHCDTIIGKIPVDNKPALELVRRQGWECTGEEGNFLIFTGSLRDAHRSRFIRSLKERSDASRLADAQNLNAKGTASFQESLIVNNHQAQIAA